MNTQEIAELHKQYVMPTYAPGLALVRGKGTRVWDAEGNEYLDFLGGIAVNVLGHAHPKLVKAIRQQAARLMHVSNLYFNENQPRLAKALSERSLGGKCFFCNSGAEANEGLFKLARLWGHAQGRHEIVAMTNSFHGRTLATVAATGQTKYQKGFEPMPAGFVHAEYNNLDAVRAAVTDKTVAILVEAVQGEGGVVPAKPEFLAGLRALCDERNLLLLCDEVQCGVGRTGKWFGFQAYGIQPDAFSVAKGLAGGFPIGAIVAGPKLSDVFQPGNHASTFGGNPLACAAALSVIEAIEEEKLLDHAAAMGELFMAQLRKIAKKFKFIMEVRGLGLMIGMVLDRPAKPLEVLLREKGLIAIATHDTVIRFLPPLNITAGQVRKAARIVKAACAEWTARGLA
ncbi:MAG TPA: aspartate aminotransferase family protein [Kiritimatiellia bacterium]|nr:aspartate aminotransferase family protein [Kiritimatiellia bacterium]HRZ13384.1 aspartate aminotransferase family protein [Kiritimatiellia bacterium]HSA18976.1 aspartate aminotransferase family protein [Kiritimatiellia bacterium]